MACLSEGVEVGYQASRSQTAEVRVSLQQPNPVECHTNRQAAHSRPKSLISPEAINVQPITVGDTTAAMYFHQ